MGIEAPPEALAKQAGVTEPRAAQTQDRAIFQLPLRTPFLGLGDFPTPIEPLAESIGDADGFIKRDDLSSAIYGGNKVRTLEVLFADACARGAETIVSTGAYGSNHALASQLHAPRAGLIPKALLFPQPRSASAKKNFELTAAHARTLLHWSTLPLGMWSERETLTYIMPPGGATPLGALGYVSAALEVAEQIVRNDAPLFREVYVGVGSTCTSAGLIAGFIMAERMGLLERAPRVVAVRVTPWPVTSAVLIARLAVQTSRRVAEETRDPRFVVSLRQALRLLRVDGGQLGRGYGRATKGGAEAITRFAPHLELDSTYSGKSAAAFLARRRTGPALFWSTKSTAPLPSPPDLPAGRARRWLASVR